MHIKLFQKAWVSELRDKTVIIHNLSNVISSQLWCLKVDFIFSTGWLHACGNADGSTAINHKHTDKHSLPNVPLAGRRPITTIVIRPRAIGIRHAINIHIGTISILVEALQPTDSFFRNTITVRLLVETPRGDLRIVVAITGQSCSRLEAPRWISIPNLGDMDYLKRCCTRFICSYDISLVTFIQNHPALNFNLPSILSITLSPSVSKTILAMMESQKSPSYLCFALGASFTSFPNFVAKIKFLTSLFSAPLTLSPIFSVP